MNAPSTTALSVHRAIPQAPGFDNTVALLAEGYRFIGKRCDALGSDIFATRLKLRRVICVRGEAAARMFYQPGRFTRKRAIPASALALLQDHGNTQELDGEMRQVHKALMLSLQSPASRARLVALAEREWRSRFERWPRQRSLVLLQEAQAVLCRAACAWAGVPLASVEEEVLRTAELSAMIDGAGAVGPRNWLGTALGRHTRQWAHEHIAQVRAGRATDPDSPLAAIAFDVDPEGEVLSTADAADVLVNVLLALVAVAHHIVFGALAMHEHPQWRTRLGGGDDAALSLFAEEVRRYYPFFPAIGGHANHAFAWNGMLFNKDDWVLLDVYGTNHHPGTWPDGELFRPERFEGRQGGADLAQGQRWPEQTVTVELTRSALGLLAGAIDYAVPPQDLTVSLERVPAQPASGLVLADVRPR